MTHDVPRRTKTQNWILWFVEVVDVAVVALMTEEESVAGRLLLGSSSFGSSEEDGSDYGSPMSFRSGSELGSRREVWHCILQVLYFNFFFSQRLNLLLPSWMG